MISKMKNRTCDLDIFKILPQRYPFLMVDKIIKTDDKKMVTLKNVSNNEPHFQGHFPGNAIMPGVLIVEAMIQTSNLLAAYIAEKLGNIADLKEHVSYVTAIDKAKFLKPVVPGDHLYLTVSLLNKMGPAWRFTGKADVTGIVVAEATWMGVLTKELRKE